MKSNLPGLPKSISETGEVADIQKPAYVKSEKDTFEEEEKKYQNVINDKYHDSFHDRLVTLERKKCLEVNSLVTILTGAVIALIIFLLSVWIIPSINKNQDSITNINEKLTDKINDNKIQIEILKNEMENIKFNQSNNSQPTLSNH